MASTMPASARRPRGVQRRVAGWAALTVLSALVALGSLRTPLDIFGLYGLLALYAGALGITRLIARERPRLALGLASCSLLLVGGLLVAGPFVLVTAQLFPNIGEVIGVSVITLVMLSTRWPFNDRRFILGAATAVATLIAAVVLLPETAPPAVSPALAVALDIPVRAGDGLIVHTEVNAAPCGQRARLTVTVFGSTEFWQRNASKLNGTHRIAILASGMPGVRNVGLVGYVNDHEVREAIQPPGYLPPLMPIHGKEALAARMGTVRSLPGDAALIAAQVTNWAATRVPLRFGLEASVDHPKGWESCYLVLPMLGGIVLPELAQKFRRQLAAPSGLTVATPTVSSTVLTGTAINLALTTSTPLPTVIYGQFGEWLCGEPNNPQPQYTVPSEGEPSAPSDEYTFDQATNCSSEIVASSANAQTVANLILVLIGAGGSLAATLLVQPYLRPRWREHGGLYDWATTRDN
jgi:hypothetical protein